MDQELNNEAQTEQAEETEEVSGGPKSMEEFNQLATKRIQEKIEASDKDSEQPLVEAQTSSEDVGENKEATHSQTEAPQETKISSLEQKLEQLTALVAQVAELQKPQAQAPEEKAFVPNWNRPLTDRHELLAKQELGEDAPPHLVADYIEALRNMTRSEPWLDHKEEGQAKAARSIYNRAQQDLRFITHEAKLARLEAENKALREQRELASKPKQLDADKTKTEVLAALQSPQALSSIKDDANYAGLVKALEAGVFKMEDLMEDINLDQPWDDVWADIDKEALRASKYFAKMNLTQKQETKKGLSVENPSLFSARKDEQTPDVKPRGLLSLDELSQLTMNRVAAKA